MMDGRPLLKSRLLFLALVVVVLDQWTKWLIEISLARHEAMTIIPRFIDLVHVTNSGVAFGLFPTGGELAGTLLLSGLGLGALAIVVAYYLRTPPTQRLLLTSLTLVLGGAVGNLIDRLMKGAVTDFIDVYVGTRHWPTFNLADSAISVGIVLMAIETLRPRAPVGTSEEAMEN